MKKELLGLYNVSDSDINGNSIRNIYLNLYTCETLGIYTYSQSDKMLLFNILAGQSNSSTGIIQIEERQVRLPQEIQEKVGFVVEKESLVPSLTIAENIELLRPNISFTHVIRQNTFNRNVSECLNHLGLLFHPNHLVKFLTNVDRRIVELVRLYYIGMRIIVLDTSAFQFLSNSDTNRFIAFLRLMQRNGVSFIIFLNDSHFFMTCCDRTAVFSFGCCTKILSSEEYTHFRSSKPSISPLDVKLFKPKRTISQVPYSLLSMDAITSFHLQPGKITTILTNPNLLSKNCLEQFFKITQELNGDYHVTYSIQRDSKQNMHSLAKAGIYYLYTNQITNYICNNLSVLNNTCLSLTNNFRRSRGLVFRRGIYAYISKQLERDYGTLYPIPQKRCETLNHEQKLQLVFNRILLAAPKVFFCINPYTNLYSNQVNIVEDFLIRLAQNGVAVAILTHRMSHFDNFCNQSTILHDTSL